MGQLHRRNNMIQRIATGMFALAGFAPAGKPDYANCQEEEISMPTPISTRFFGTRTLAHWVRCAAAALVLVAALASTALAQPAVTVSPTAGPPTDKVTVGGTGFGASEAVDIYFDKTDRALATAQPSGSFSGISLTVPASATPGPHWITGVGRHSGLAAQTTFRVETNWTEFHFGPQRRGYNPTENVLNVSNVAGLQERWSWATQGQVDSSPAVANGGVYVGSDDGYLYALNASTGQQIWTAANTGAPIQSSPAVANGVVYVGSLDNNLYAFNASTGQQLWSAPTGGPINSSPAVANGVVYVGSQDNNLYAFNAATGQRLWTAATGGSIASSPAVANGVVYVGSWDNNLYAFNAATGQLLWSAATREVIQSSPAVANGVVYVGSNDNNLYAFNAATSQLLWSAATGQVDQSSPAVANGVVYVGSWDFNLYAFNAATGQLLWSAATRGVIESRPPDKSTNRRRRWPMASSTWGRGISTFTLSTPRPGNCSGARPPVTPSALLRRWPMV